jgi:hypothetical protein
MSSDPFSRYRAEPVQAQPAAEAAADASPAKNTPPPTNPFIHHKYGIDPSIQFRLKGTPEPPAAERLMAWLPRWPKETISVREVRIFGPISLRDRKIAEDAVEALVSCGRLVPVETRQRNMNWWLIVRGSCSTRCSAQV